jgi:MtN3 and saliva related transmembrane protein
MDLRELLGFMGGLLTNIGFVPQIWRLLKLKSAHEVSLPFVYLFILGIGCWFLYGIVFGLLSVIVWNGIAIILGCLMLYAKLKYGR